jgi:thioredoxin reductase (NADPH)
MSDRQGRRRHLRAEDGVLRAVVLDDGEEFPVDAVAVAPRFNATAELFEQLGRVLREHPNGAFIPTDPAGRTPTPGVWAAGNAGNLAAMVVAAMGAGVTTAAAINADLVAEDADAAVQARRTVSRLR